jgi:hypothetical protein|tara:strand:+ start:432 stop:1016 length:585 start_codon:yes stop_codon:yes gene_type:complete
MKRNKVIQFLLVIVGVILFFFTYYSGDKDEVVNIEKNISTEDMSKSTEATSNIIENIKYVGTDNRGTFFDINAKLAEVHKDKPSLSSMKIVNAVIRINNGRKIYIKSDHAIYNRSTNNTKFIGNVLITESSNKITSDNLDLIMSENLIKIFNNVKYHGEKGFIISDKVNIDILKNEAILFMKNSNDKVRVKYKN